MEVILFLAGVYAAVVVYGLWSIVSDYRGRKAGHVWGGQRVWPDLLLWVIWPILVATSPITRILYRRWKR